MDVALAEGRRPPAVRRGLVLAAIAAVCLGLLLTFPHWRCTFGDPFVIVLRNGAAAPITDVEVDAYAYCEWREGRFRERRPTLSPGDELRISRRGDYDLSVLRVAFDLGGVTREPRGQGGIVATALTPGEPVVLVVQPDGSVRVDDPGGVRRPQ